MKSKHDHNKKIKRTSYNDVDERKGLKSVKSKDGKSKRISIYDDLDEDDDNMDFELDDFSLNSPDFEDNYYDDEDDY